MPHPTTPKTSWYNVRAAALARPTVSIYDEIGYWGVTAQDFISEFNALDALEIELRINSPGGSVFEGMAIYNAIKRHPAKVFVYVDGLAASMGSIIALAGDEINMAENSFFMIHNPWGGAVGEASDLRAYADRLDDMRELMANIYEAKSTLTREQVLAAMDAETWYPAAQANEIGFAENLTETLTAAACYHGVDAASRFVKAPITIERASIDQAPPQPDQLTHLRAAKIELLRLEDNL